MAREDLVRAFWNYFKVKGLGAPTDPRDILPVIVLDDNSSGPYPPYRAFFSGRSIGPTVGQNSYVGIVNADSSEKKSVLVVDHILARVSAADDLVVFITTTAVLALANVRDVSDAAQEKEQQVSDQPRIGNVQTTSTGSAVGLGIESFPLNATTQTLIPGPFTLAPQAVLWVRTGIFNNQLWCWFRGRYYPTV